MKRNWLVVFGTLAVLVPLCICTAVKQVNADYNEDGTVKIDETNFPDEQFREFVTRFDYNEDGVLDQKELSSEDEFHLVDFEIKSIQGIEFFTNLKVLNCQYNLLTELDLSKNVMLEEVNCSANKLTSLQIMYLEKLRFLDCTQNSLTELCTFGSGLSRAVEEGFEEEENRHVFFYISSRNICLYCDKTTRVETRLGDGVDGFIERLYLYALNRDSDEDGLKYWVNEIESGSKSSAGCARFFLIEAPEFLNRGLSDEDFVETLYKTFFNRDSEAEGKSFWVGELKNKRMSRQIVIAGFIDSKEWCNVCATYGVRSGAPTAKAEFASKNAIAFSTRLYTCCLGRAPEKDGLNYWSLALTNLEQTGAGAAKLFFTLEEFVNLKTDDTEYLTRLYRTFMGREPEAGGMKYWLGELRKGATRESVMSGFAVSEEFTNICKTYGIERGEI